MMRNVVVGSSLNPFDNGDMAVLLSTIGMLKSAMPDTSYTVLVLSSPEIMEGRYGTFLKANDTSVIAAPWCDKEGRPTLKSKVCFLLRSLPIAPFKRGFLRDYDEYLELGLDHHVADTFGLNHFYASLYPLLLCILFEKPFIVYAASVGPFETKLSRLAAKFVFGRARLITVREQRSLSFLHQLGISQNLFLTADAAFLLEPAGDERVDEILAAEDIDKDGHPLVGMSLSGFRAAIGNPDMKDYRKKQRVFVELAARIADYVVETKQAAVLLIPRSMGTDVPMIQEIHREMKQKHMAKVLGDQYTADEQAGIIGRCQLFVASRMHAAVAAVSAGVPTIALSHSHKFQGVLGPFLDDKCIISVWAHSTPDDSFDHICRRIDDLWQNRDAISQELRSRRAEVMEEARRNAQLVKEVSRL